MMQLPSPRRPHVLVSDQQHLTNGRISQNRSRSGADTLSVVCVWGAGVGQQYKITNLAIKVTHDFQRYVAALIHSNDLFVWYRVKTPTEGHTWK